MKRVIGIYRISNPVGEIYIGQSRTIYERWSGYMCLSYVKGQVRLYNSFVEYGIENHIFEIVEECEFDLLNKRERFWQDFHNVIGPNGLNCVLQDADEKPRVYSEETRKRMSEGAKGKIFSPETREKLRITSTGRKLSTEARAKISKALTGKKLSKEHIEKLAKTHLGKTTPDEVRKKMSESHIGVNTWMLGRKAPQEVIDKRVATFKERKCSYKPIIQMDKEGNFVAEWESMVTAAKALGIHQANISGCCRGRVKSIGGFTWKYKEKNE